MRNLIRWFLMVAGFIILINPVPMFSQDTRLNINSHSYTIVSSQAWSGFNKTYVFRPIRLENSLYIFIKNDNPTSSHSLTVTVHQTPSTNVVDYSNNTGFWVSDIVNGNCNYVAANSMSSCWISTLFASQVAVTIQNAATASGSPDTGDIYILQGDGNPQSQGIGISGNSSVGIQSLSNVSTYAATGTATNPAANAAIFSINPTTINVHLNKLFISTTVTSTLQIGIDTVVPTCNGAFLSSLNLANGNLQGVIAGIAPCSVPGNINLDIMDTVIIPTNTTQEFDFDGMIIGNGSAFVIYAKAAITGTLGFSALFNIY